MANCVISVYWGVSNGYTCLLGAVRPYRKSTELTGDRGSSSTLFPGTKVYVCITESYMTLGSFNSQIMSNILLPPPHPTIKT